MRSAVPGRLVAGRYRLESVIGRGGMGVVWRARDTLLARQVAVKELLWPPDFTREERQIACRRTTREAQMAARLTHPSIVRVYDIVEEDGQPWIVMELLPYQSLRDLVREDGPLAPARAARVGLGILAGLRAAHAEGIVHRDVKPANILVGPDGKAVLTDFGIARAAGSPTLTNAGDLIGSPSYTAPERARGEAAGAPGDLWGLGASLYAAVEGRPPFEGASALATLTAVVADEPDQARNAGPLWPLISALLGKDPAGRPDAAEIERVLRAVADEGANAGEGADEEATRVMAAPPPLASAGPPPPFPEPAAAPEPGPSPEPGPAAPAGAPPEAGQPGQDAAPPAAVVPPGPPGPPDAVQARRGRSRRHLVLPFALAALAVVACAAVFIVTYGAAPGHPTAAAPAGSRDSATAGPGTTRGAASAPSSHGTASSTAPPPATTPATRTPRSPASSPAQSATGSSGSQGSGYGALPAGFYRFTNSTGFSIGVPQGWQISHVGHYVYIRDPANGGIFLLIDQSDHPKPNPLADWRQQQANRASGYPGYHLIRLASVRYPQAEKAADWEFTYDRDGVMVHILNRNVLANAHHAYALYWSVPQAQWSAYYHYFQAFAATFRPAS
jgi:hypothetical protein